MLVRGDLPNNPFSADPQPASPGIRSNDLAIPLQATEGPGSAEPSESGTSSAGIVIDPATQASMEAVHHESGPSSIGMSPSCYFCEDIASLEFHLKGILVFDVHPAIIKS